MGGLGYGEQPYIIYRHNDIDRTHYHVVSIRINHDGRKIPDRLERRKCNSLLKDMAPRFGIQVGRARPAKGQQNEHAPKQRGKKM